MLKLKFVGLWITFLLLAGCASNEYYRDKAANSARNFIYSEYQGMTPENRAYIEYTYPTILIEPIFSKTTLYNQLCFAWSLPSPKVIILVYGTGKANFYYWYPQRIIFKQVPKEIAAQEAVNFILDQHKDISDINRYYIEDTFPRTLVPAQNNEKNKSIKTTNAGKQELCLGWILNSPKSIILVYGLGYEDFSDWTPTRIVLEKYSDKLAKQLKEEKVFSNEADLDLDKIIEHQNSHDQTQGWNQELGTNLESQLSK